MYFITTIQKRKKKYRLNGNYFSFRMSIGDYGPEPGSLFSTVLDSYVSSPPYQPGDSGKQSSRSCLVTWFSS